MITPEKQPQTVTPEGKSVKPLIHDVKIHRPVTHEDERGSLCEIYHPGWNFDSLPLTNAYLVTVSTGRIKGWALHKIQTDRYFFVQGHIKLVLYDDRESSPTRGMINELYFSEINRALVSVSPGIYHAVANIGNSEALMFNIPSHPYQHDDPDKFTLPLENSLIPYSFDMTSHHLTGHQTHTID